MFFISILLIQVQEVQKQAKIMIFPQTPPWILKFFVILMSTCYNKSNLKVKESSEQFWIEMSISNGVLYELSGQMHLLTECPRWWIIILPVNS